MPINHITFICQDIERSAALFCDLFQAVEVYSSDGKNFSLSQEKFLLIDNLWIALMQGAQLHGLITILRLPLRRRNLRWRKQRLG